MIKIPAIGYAYIKSAEKGSRRKDPQSLPLRYLTPREAIMVLQVADAKAAPDTDPRLPKS